MASEKDVCNRALLLIGSRPISTLEEDTPEAIICNEALPMAIEFVLMAYNWSSIRATSQLASVLDENTLERVNIQGKGFVYVMPLAGLLIHPLDIVENFPYVIEGGLLYSPSEVVHLLYTKKENDFSKYSISLVNLISLKLSAIIAQGLKSSPTIAVSQENKFELEKDKAIGQEGTNTDDYDYADFNAFNEGQYRSF